MHTYDAILEPFDARTLAAIRTAFQASWEELCRQEPRTDLFLRNRLVGAIATLAQSGIDDPGELKRKALHKLELGSVTGMTDSDLLASGFHLANGSIPCACALQGAAQP
jgi:hypothetical protein